jgi:hypothetical protein
VLFCAVLCCAVLCCAVLCCSVLCCAVLQYASLSYGVISTPALLCSSLIAVHGDELLQPTNLTSLTSPISQTTHFAAILGLAIDCHILYMGRLLPIINSLTHQCHTT